MSARPGTKWWGWGLEGKGYDLESRPDLWPFLVQRLRLNPQLRCPPIALRHIHLPAPRLDASTVSELMTAVGQDNVCTDERTRLTHSMGKSYRDLVRLRQGRVDNPPDAVIFPGDGTDVRRVLDIAARRKLAVVPFGGGTSVLGGVEALPGSCRGVLCVDLARLNRVLAVDIVSRTARVEAGMTGPALEAVLESHGYTLGHYPQSFEFSTLGGWIATRSAGHASTLYGKIEDMVVSLRLETPAGTIETRSVPASATGPDLKHLIIGSEGVLGILTEATLRLRLIPEQRDYRAVMFRTFADGLSCVRELVQRGITPATVRLSDAVETELLFKIQRHKPGEGGSLKTRIGKLLLDWQHYRLVTACFMLLGYEGEAQAVSAQWRWAAAVAARHGAFGLGHGPARDWLAERYELPYLRDDLLERGVLVDTLETATTWDNLGELHSKLLAAIARASEDAGSPALVMAHVSHAYREGASLYVTFLARQAYKHEIEQWQTIKRAASDCIMANGGTISHHHGVGYEHLPWLEAEWGPGALAALRALKASLDPQGIMNPGKLIPYGDQPRP